MNNTLKAAIENQHITYRETIIQMIANVFLKFQR